jgi:hypothetical protein
MKASDPVQEPHGKLPAKSMIERAAALLPQPPPPDDRRKQAGIVPPPSGAGSVSRRHLRMPPALFFPAFA